MRSQWGRCNLPRLIYSTLFLWWGMIKLHFTSHLDPFAMSKRGATVATDKGIGALHACPNPLRNHLLFNMSRSSYDIFSYSVNYGGYKDMFQWFKLDELNQSIIFNLMISPKVQPKWAGGATQLVSFSLFLRCFSCHLLIFFLVTSPSFWDFSQAFCGYLSCFQLMVAS